MSYTHVFLPSAFLLFACVSAALSGNAGDEDVRKNATKPVLLKPTLFAVHTRENPNGIAFSVDELSPYIKPKAYTKIIVHGQFHTNHIQDIIKAYVYDTSSDFNIITFQWKFVWHLKYSDAARTANYLGTYVFSKAIAKIGCLYKLHPNQIHLIGHNLGAHMAGIAAANLSPKIARLTGLDPSRKCFEIPCDGVTFTGLNRTVADFVDVVHTNAFIKGYGSSMGTVDLYPNGGVFQPTCYSTKNMNCNSIMSLRYYADAIKLKKDYSGVLCDSQAKFYKNECKNGKVLYWPYLGGEGKITPGSYYFETEAESPYNKGKGGLIPEEHHKK